MKAKTEATVHELLAGIFGWVWILATLGAVVCLFWALFGNLSWWWTVGLFLAGGFFKAVTRQYMKERDTALARHQIERNDI